MGIKVPAIPRGQWEDVGKRYLSGLSMQTVADEFGVSLDAVVYILRKTKVPRRDKTESNRLSYEARPASFSVLPISSEADRALVLAGTMLYWAEGYKTRKASGMDFANSDPDMIDVFMQFLRRRYVLDTDRIICSVYAYADQDLDKLIKFWVRKTGVPKERFKHHYIRRDFKADGRKLSYGVLHIKYNDKKLLRDILNLIESYRSRYCVGGGVV